MRLLTLGIGAATVILVGLVPSTAGAQRVVPPGNSGVDQYTETFQAAGGDTPSNDKSSVRPEKILGARNAKRLEGLGPDGRGAAALAAATAPNQNISGGVGGLRNDAKKPGGSSGLSEVIEQAVGRSSSGGVEFLLPLVIVVVVAGSLTYLWRRQRQAT